MKNLNASRSHRLSFNRLSILTYSLLTPVQRLKAGKQIILSILLALLEVVSLTAVLPLLFQLLTDSSVGLKIPFLKNGIPVDSWLLLLISIVTIFLIKNSATVWLARQQLKSLNNLYLEFSERLYRQFYRLDWSAYSHTNSAEVFRNIKNTAFEFTGNVLGNYYLLIADVTTCLLMTSVLIWIDYRIILVLLALGLPIGISYLFFHKRVILKIDQSFRKLTPETNIILSQGIESFAEARIYKKENFFIKRFIDISTITTSQLADLKVYSIFPSRLLETLGVILFAAFVAYEKLFQSQGHNPVVIVGLVSLALYRIVPSLNRALQSLSQIQAYSYSVPELTKHLVSSKPDRKSNLPLDFQHKIILHSVSFDYAQAPVSSVLKEINCIIKKGDFILLEGNSGAGKTTLLHLLAGLITNYKGEIIIDETPITFEMLDAWQEKVAIVQQSPLVLQDTILNNICFGETVKTIDPAKVELSIRQAGIRDFIYSLPQQLNTPVGEHGLTLSGGQRQRICLARALYRNPDVLLLDEVTNQLDEESKIMILSTLQSLCSQGKTVILSSHDQRIRDFANRVFHLKSGVLVEDYSLKEG